ncbi:MAG: phenylalanine--tRNA ligase subunit beta [Acidobacteria bacterium]|nr:phenylalanine--tRNA ligase subunit beta [Acidobacteriota bacterium]
MNISYNWLKELIDIDLSAEETAAALTRVGLAVEGIHPHKGDLVLDIDLTSNRSDCLSHLGVARELGVITGRSLKATSGSAAAGDELDAVPFPSVLAPEVVRVDAPEFCNRFTARVIRGVKIGPSPEWLVDRLEALGERSINNVADITNYVMLELGQPMHAFDLDKLAEKRIVVRTARAGETITTLDEIERTLDETMLAICDAERPVAVAGVMGGIESGITETTTNVLLEVAYFKRENIRQTSRKLGLATEASYRFERGVDIENLIRASDRATELIVQLAGGEAADIVDVYPERQPERTVRSADVASAVKRLTGLDVAADECERILSALGIARIGDGEYTSPTWRHDIAIEEDLVEEVARHAGYENIKDELPPAFGAGEYQASEVRKRRLRGALVEQGFDEAIAYSFIDVRHDDLFAAVPEFLREGGEEKFVTLKDSVIEGSVRMRPTLIPGLLGALRLNLNHQRRDVKLFEIGKAFAASGMGELPTERELFTIAVTGGEVHEDRAMPARQLDLYDAKGAVEAALEAAGAADCDYRPAEISHLRAGQSGEVVKDGRVVGTFGRLNEEIAANYKFKQPVYVAELDLQTILAEPSEPAVYTPLSRFPAVVRDISFLVPRSLTFAEIQSSAIGADATNLRAVSFVDIFEGKGLADDVRSLTIRLEFRSDERTLTDAEVDAEYSAVLTKLKHELSLEPRT